MKIHEYQAKEIFAKFGIPIPKGEVTSSPEEARQLAVKYEMWVEGEKPAV